MKMIVVAALLLVLHVPAFAGPTAPASPGAPVDPAGYGSRKMDINRATAAELVSVPGIGERLAQAIIDLRERKGSFAKLDDLLEVRGIGEKNLALFADHLMVAQQSPPAAGGALSQAK